MANPTSTRFASAMREGVGKTLIIDAGVAAILAQPDFPVGITEAPDLRTHQIEAKKVAKLWAAKDGVREKLFASNSAVLDYDNMFGVFYEEMMKRTDDLSKRFELSMMLKALHTNIQNQKRKVSAAADALKDFVVQMEAAQHLVQTDLDALLLLINGKEGETGTIQTLLDAVKACSDAIVNQWTIIALASATVVVGGLMIAVGVAMAIPTLGTSAIVLCTAGVVVAGTGVAGIAIAAEEMKKQNKLKTELNAKIAVENGVLAVANDLKQSLGDLADNMGSISDAGRVLAQTWEQYGGEFDNLIDQLDKADPNRPLFMVKNYLVDMKKDFTELAAAARAFKNQSMPPKVDDSAAKESLATGKAVPPRASVQEKSRM